MGKHREMSGFEMQIRTPSWQGDTSQETTLNIGPNPFSTDIIITISFRGFFFRRKVLIGHARNIKE